MSCRNQCKECPCQKVASSGYSAAMVVATIVKISFLINGVSTFFAAATGFLPGDKLSAIIVYMCLVTSALIDIAQHAAKRR